MSKPLTRRDLVHAGCSEPNCTHDHNELFFHGQCHIGAGTSVAYTKNDGVLTVRCNACKRLVGRLAIAP